MKINVQRVSPIEIKIAMEPYDARIVAHALRQIVSIWGAENSDRAANSWAIMLTELASNLQNAIGDRRKS